MAAAGFFSRQCNGPLPFNLKSNMLSASLNKTFPSFYLAVRPVRSDGVSYKIKHYSSYNHVHTTTVHTTMFIQLQFIQPCSYNYSSYNHIHTITVHTTMFIQLQFTQPCSYNYSSHNHVHTTTVHTTMNGNCFQLT